MTFSDEATKELDLEPYLNGPLFAPVRDQATFRQAVAEDDPDAVVALVIVASVLALTPAAAQQCVLCFR